MQSSSLTSRQLSFVNILLLFFKSYIHKFNKIKLFFLSERSRLVVLELSSYRLPFIFYLKSGLQNRSRRQWPAAEILLSFMLSFLLLTQKEVVIRRMNYLGPKGRNEKYPFVNSYLKSRSIVLEEIQEKGVPQD